MQIEYESERNTPTEFMNSLDPIYIRQKTKPAKSCFVRIR